MELAKHNYDLKVSYCDVEVEEKCIFENLYQIIIKRGGKELYNGKQNYFIGFNDLVDLADNIAYSCND